MTTIKLSEIQIDAGSQARAGINEHVVSDYSEAMKCGATFPPVILFHDGSRVHVGDGFHRILASGRTGRIDIEADIRKGTAVDALWFALGANREHGLRMTNKDMEHAIISALKTWPERSSRMIAEQIGCSHQHVEKFRRRLGTCYQPGCKSASTKESGSNSNRDHVTGRDGRSYRVRRGKRVKTEERVRQIAELAANGLTASQIATQLNVCTETVLKLSKESGITLADQIIGKRRKIDINRIIGETANSAESLTSGLELINGNLDGLDLSRAVGWAETLRSTITILNQLVRKLERTIRNGKQNAGEVQQES